MCYIKGIDGCDQWLTGNPAFAVRHGSVSFDGTLMDQRLQLKRFGTAPILSVYWRIVFIYNVQDNTVVFLVEMMPVLIPVGRIRIDFYMPHQTYLGNIYHRIQKIGAFIEILRSCSFYTDRLFRDCMHIVLFKKTKIPDKLDDTFRKFHKAK